jgi:hypothetical protein
MIAAIYARKSTEQNGISEARSVTRQSNTLHEQDVLRPRLIETVIARTVERLSAPEPA